MQNTWNEQKKSNEIIRKIFSKKMFKIYAECPQIKGH